MLLWTILLLLVPLAGVAGFLVGMGNRARIGALDRRLADGMALLARRIARLEQAAGLGSDEPAVTQPLPVRYPPSAPQASWVPPIEPLPEEAPAMAKPDSSAAEPAPTMPEPESMIPETELPALPSELPASIWSPAAPSDAAYPAPPVLSALSSAEEATPPAQSLPLEPSFASQEPPPISPPAPPSLPPAPRRTIDWEGLVGVKLFSWIAGVALVFAAVFFLRYSIEHGWLSPSIRMAIGLLTGAGLLVGCELRAARRYPVTANALDAAGIAILFSTLFASHALWNLLPQLPVFALMALVAAVAVLLSIRRDSVFIALLGLVGGFATPALLSTGEDRPIALFSYLMLLNVGLAWVAYRKSWPVLTSLSVAFTTLYQWGWVFKFLDAARLPLAAGIFLVFPIMHVLAFAFRRSRREGEDPRFGQAMSFASIVPVLFALYLAAVPAYGEHYALLFGLLLLVSVGLGLVAAMLGPEILHAGGAVASVIAFSVWFGASYTSEAWPGVLGFLACFIAWYLAAPHVAQRLGRPFTVHGEQAMLAAPALLFAFPMLAFVEPATAAPGLLFGVLFVFLAVISAAAVVREDGVVYFTGALFALAAEAVWSGKFLEPERLLSALAIYAAFALFYLGVPIAAERAGKRLQPEGGGSLVLLLGIALLFFLAIGPVAHSALWGIAILLAILNAGLFAQASAGGPRSLTIAGVGLSWIVIAAWWSAAMTPALVFPALLVVAGFTALILGGGVLTLRESADGPAAHDRSLALALVGHAFLLFVAAQADLAVPPWPLFGILALLDLAIGAAALYTRRAALHVAAIVASQVIVLVWMLVAVTPPWPTVGMLAADAVAAFAFGWFVLVQRRPDSSELFAAAAAVGVFLAQALTIVSAQMDSPPELASLVANHVALLVALLAVTWRSGRHVLAVLAVVPTAIGSGLWIFQHADAWQGGLVFVTSIYVVFLAYPMALGARAGRSRAPYVAAVAASLPFLLLARQCILAGGWESVIGLLPLAQAACMLALLQRVLAIEPAGEREIGRLALVAGAALALVTVAIPLQLSRQWITVAWALEGASLAWLYRRIPFKQLIVWSAGLCVAVFVRLALNPWVFEYHARASVPIWNWYLYTYLVSAAALFAAAWWLRDVDDSLFDGMPRVSDALSAAATVLLFLILNIEIADFYSTGSSLTFNFSGDIAQDLTYTIGWAVFAIVLLTAGIARRRSIVRISALGLLVITITKCFLHDLWRLGGLYRVGSFVGLAVCLALVAVLLQKFVFGGQEESA